MTCPVRALGPLAAMVAVACAPDPPCGLRACDIRAADCQLMAAEAAACLREVPSVPVPVVVVSRDEYNASVTSVPLTADEEEAFRRWNAGLTALGMAPADDTPATNSTASANQLGAFYSSTATQITIIDDGYPLDSVYAVALLVHENMHAIQHARFHLADLRTAHATDLDRALALGAVSEGEATYVQDLATAGFFGLGKDDIDWPAVLARWQESARHQARSSPRPVSLSWSHFRYPFGTGYVLGAYDASGWAGVDALYGMPPDAARQVMAGFGAPAPEGGAWAEDLGGDSIPVLDPARYDFVGAERMGAWLLYAFLNRPYETRGVEDLPSLLRGDVLSIFFDRITGGAVVFWRLRLGPLGEEYFWLDERIRKLQQSRLTSAWSPTFAGGDDVIVAASDAATLDAIPTDTAYQPIPPAPAAAPLAARLGGIGCVRPAPEADAP